MSQNLITEYSTRLDERFKQGSLTEAWCGHDYDWSGVNAISIYTLGQATINDYNAGNGISRYGNVTEFDDEVNTYTLQKKRSFTHSLDETYMQDQKGIKKANALLKQIWDEQMIPEIDQYRLKTWANGAGLGKIDGNALTNSTIMRALLEANKDMNNKHVPKDGRGCFITESMAVETRLASELQYNDGYTDKTLVNGQICKLVGMPIIAVPDDWMPKGVEFMIKYKRASADPMKLKKLLSHKDPMGVAGTVIEGLTRYDSFVLAQKTNGIYVYAKEDMQAAVTFSMNSTSGKLTLTSANGTIKYTKDGTNPKTSSTASTYSAAIDVVSGDLVRAYASSSGNLNSYITEYKVS